MVDGMIAAPGVIGCQRQDAEHAPDPIIQLAFAIQCSMTAIMLNGEQPHEETTSKHHKAGAEPIADAQCRPGEYPKGGKRQYGDQQLNRASAAARLAVGRQDADPGACIR